MEAGIPTKFTRLAGTLAESIPADQHQFMAFGTIMKTVYIYSFTGKFSGNAEYKFVQPEMNAVHKCMLFLAQDNNETQIETAVNEIKKFGFDKITNLTANELKTEVLNSSQFKGFKGYYEEALNAGSSLAYYPEED